MIRNLKVLGVALAAVLALTAVVASTASASGQVTCDTYPCTLTGTSALGNDVFVTEGGKVECKSAFHSSLTKATSELTVTPTYTECKAFGFVNATVNMNGCDYTFTTPTKLATHEWTSGANSAPVPPNPDERTHVLCPAGKAIEINAGTCKVAIHPQTLEGHLTITNTTNAGLDDLDVQATYTGIDYTVTQDGFGCPFTGTGPKDGATYNQGVKVTIHAEGQNVHVG